MYWYVLVCPGIYWFILVCTGTYQHVLHIFPTHKSCWNIGIQTGTYQDVHSGTLSYCLVSSCPLLETWRYKAVQGSEIGTMRYMAVPESPVPLDMEVQGGTRPCTFMYFLVPAYPGVLDFLVLPCTSLYQFHCLVPPCTAMYPEEDKRIQGGMTVYQNGHPGMFQFVSEYSNKRKYV
jgi:hypothetical protein